MLKTLDYNIAWADTIKLVQGHREAIVAVAGFFIFIVNWAFAFLAPQLEIGDASSASEIYAILQGYFQNNWMYIAPMTLITSYGSLVIYVLLAGQGLATVGDALTRALAILVPYLIASLLLGWITFLGFAAFVIPGLYLTGRFCVLPAVMASNPKLGVSGAFRQTWSLTASAGWVAFFLLLIVGFLTWLITAVSGLIVGLCCLLLAGEGGLPIVETGFAALMSTGQAVILSALIVSVFRQLGARMANQ